MEVDDRLVGAPVHARQLEVQVERNVGAAQLDAVSDLPAVSVDELLAGDEGVAAGFPDRELVVGEVEIVEDRPPDRRVRGELTEEVLRPRIDVRPAKPDLRRDGEDAGDLLHLLPVAEGQEVAEPGRVLHEDARGALLPRGVELHRGEQGRQDDDQDEHEDDGTHRQERARLLAEDVLPDEGREPHWGWRGGGETGVRARGDSTGTGPAGPFVFQHPLELREAVGVGRDPRPRRRRGGQRSRRGGD